jgi:hypothetical protein
VHWQRLRHRLERAGWLVAATGGRYVLGRDLRRVRLWDLALVLEASLPELELALTQPHPTQIPWIQAYMERRRQLVEAAQSAFDVPLETLLDATPAENQGE